MAVKTRIIAGLGVILMGALGIQFAYSKSDNAAARLAIERLAAWEPIRVFASEEERIATEKILRYTSAHRFLAEKGDYDILVLVWDSGGDKMRDIVLHNPVACWPQTGWKVLATTPGSPIGPLWRGSPPIRCAFADAHGRSLNAVFWRTSGGESVPTWRVEGAKIAGFGLLAGMSDAVASRHKQQVFIRISTTGIIDEEALARIASRFFGSFGSP